MSFASISLFADFDLSRIHPDNMTPRQAEPGGAFTWGLGGPEAAERGAEWVYGVTLEAGSDVA